jgi:tetratricopeptide (TPR) repeat protein
MNFYERLQVDRKASVEVIKSAYRVLVKDGHPDVGGDEEIAKAINEAYSVLTDSAQRQRYDRELALGERASPEVTLGRAFVPEYILFCQFCGKRNRIRDEAKIPRARCGACHRKLQPSQPMGGGEGHLRSFRLGMFLYEKGLLDRAQREMQSAVRLKPNSATYRYWLGRCHYQRRVYEKALVEFKVAVSLKPRSFQFNFWLGQTAHVMKDHAAAVAAFLAAAEMRPDHAPTFHRLGSAYYELHEHENALRAFQRALEIEPRSVQSQRWLGLCHYSAGDPAAAAKAFLEADRAAPGDPFTERYLALLGQKPIGVDRAATGNGGQRKAAN